MKNRTICQSAIINIRNQSMRKTNLLNFNYFPGVKEGWLTVKVALTLNIKCLHVLLYVLLCENLFQSAIWTV